MNILDSNDYHHGTIHSLPQIYTLHKCYKLMKYSKNNFDFNVVIRTIIYDQKDFNLSFSVGSAITSESDPSIEYDECIEKLKSVFVF